MWKIPELNEIQATLRDHASPIGMRMRAAYYAKQLFVDLQKEEIEKEEKAEGKEAVDDGIALSSRSRQQQQYHHHQLQQQRLQKMEDIVSVLCEQVFVKAHGSLLRHEFAYVLGQMKTDRACTTLETLLVQENDCVMVRHEAAEALGAIASLSSKDVLESTRMKNVGTLDELADTCLLALNRLEHVSDDDQTKSQIVVGCACMLAPYNSIDPVDVDPAHQSLSTKQLGDILLNKARNNNTKEDTVGGGDDDDANYNNADDGNSNIGYQSRGDLIERYRAMFSLRNRGGEESVKQLCRALVEDTSSPLLRHEVAFVLGQLQHPTSIPALEESLSRLDEHAMVRHESAEALGAIDGSSEDWQRIESILLYYQSDFDPAVAESCIVALDAADYWGHDSNDGTVENSVTEDIATGGSFGKQKHSSTVATCEIRKQILNQHFNVVSQTS